MVKSDWFHSQKLNQKETLQTQYDLTVNDKAIENSKVDANFMYELPQLKKSSFSTLTQEIHGEINKQNHFKNIEAPAAEIEKSNFRMDILQAVIDYKVTEMQYDAMIELHQISGTRLYEHPNYEEIRHDFKKKIQIYEELKIDKSSIIEDKVGFHEIADPHERNAAFKQIKAKQLRTMDAEHQLNRINGYVPSDAFATAIQGRNAVIDYSQELITPITHAKQEANDLHLKINLHFEHEVKYENETEKRLTSTLKSYNHEEEKYLDDRKNTASAKEEFILDTTWSAKQKRYSLDVAKLLNDLGKSEPPKELKQNFDKLVSGAMQEIKKVPAISKNAEMFR
jgi:hypothetical protein